MDGTMKIHETAATANQTNGQATARPLEEWFKRLFSDGGREVELAAQAMIDDGFEPATSWTTASLGCLRYGNTPLLSLCTDAHAYEALTHLRAHIGPACHEAHATPPWPSVQARRQRQPDFDANPLVLDGHPVQVLASCEHPRVIVLGGLLTHDECDALIALARPHLKTSMIISGETGQLVLDTEFRHSQSTLLPQPISPLQRRIEQRLAALAGLPADHGEGLSVNLYGPGGKVQMHHDYFSAQALEAIGDQTPSGQRVATVVIYLNDVPAGGSTGFAAHGLKVRPVKGQAVYFDYQHLDGSMDAGSLHSGEPVLHGEKWIATLCFRGGPTDRKPAYARSVAMPAADRPEPGTSETAPVRDTQRHALEQGPGTQG